MAGTKIAEGLSIDGEVTCNEELTVHGTLRGKVTSTDQVTVGGSGVVEADVKAHTLTIEGQVTGDVSAINRVDLQTGARLVGDVKSARLTIADGASFKGNVDMDV
jgi:cytoskeletal protein CcmA (bactofilin family)